MSEREQARAAQTKPGKRNPENSERPTVQEVLDGVPGTESFEVIEGKVHRRTDVGPNDENSAFKGESHANWGEDKTPKSEKPSL